MSEHNFDLGLFAKWWDLFIRTMREFLADKDCLVPYSLAMQVANDHFSVGQGEYAKIKNLQERTIHTRGGQIRPFGPIGDLLARTMDYFTYGSVAKLNLSILDSDVCFSFENVHWSTPITELMRQAHFRVTRMFGINIDRQQKAKNNDEFPDELTILPEHTLVGHCMYASFWPVSFCHISPDERQLDLNVLNVIIGYPDDDEDDDDDAEGVVYDEDEDDGGVVYDDDEGASDVVYDDDAGGVVSDARGEKRTSESSSPVGKKRITEEPSWVDAKEILHRI
jgi:hypothetical protein